MDKVEACMEDLHAEQQNQKVMMERHQETMEKHQALMEQILLHLQNLSMEKLSSILPRSTKEGTSTLNPSPAVVVAATESFGLRKGELLTFIGENPERWLRQVERFFRLNFVFDKDRLDTIMLYLDSDALNWFLWAEENSRFDSWTHFKMKLTKRFNSLTLSLAYQRFLDL